ncbi:DUF1848 domain-containing protein [Clostridium perfringens]
MIISVSRRTDIPAFYSEWFFNRIKEGYVLVRNPFNKKQVSKVELNKDLVDCFVFWTKDPTLFLDRLDELKGYNYYFQFTLNSYWNDVELNVKKKSELIKVFRELSSKVGKEKVIWRYDPILLNPKYTKEYHYKWFEEIAKKLSGYTDKCVISFVDNYKETKKNEEELRLAYISNEDMINIASKLVKIADKYNIKIESCAEKIDLSKYGVEHGSCIDSKLIEKIVGKDLIIKKDSIREGCNCLKSIDIGEYNSCLHNCKYCYANYNSTLIHRNFETHKKDSSLLIGELNGEEKITEHYLCKEKKKENITYEQIDLFGGE